MLSSSRPRAPEVPPLLLGLSSCLLRKLLFWRSPFPPYTHTHLHTLSLQQNTRLLCALAFTRFSLTFVRILTSFLPLRCGSRTRSLNTFGRQEREGQSAVGPPLEDNTHAGWSPRGPSSGICPACGLRLYTAFRSPTTQTPPKEAILVQPRPAAPQLGHHR